MKQRRLETSDGRHAASDRAFAVGGVVSPLVGRDAELLRLRAVLARASSYHAPQLVTVLGNAGAGKSRLLVEWAAQVSDGVRVLQGTAAAGVRHAAIAGILRRRAGITDSDDVEVARERFRETVQMVFGDRRVGEVVHFLGSFLGYRYADSPFLRAFEDNPRQHDEIARSLLRHFLEIDAAGAPLVLIFDQLEVADDDTLELIEHLGEGLAGSPVVLAAVARPELVARRPRFGGGVGDADVTRLELGNLAAADAGRMFRNLLAPCGVIADELVAEAVATTHGNPGMLEGLLRVFLANGTLDVEQTPWRLDAARAARTELPVSTAQATTARVAALAPRERDLLEKAAVFGNVFWSSALVALARSEAAAPAPETGWEGAHGHDELIAGLVGKDFVFALPAGDSTIPGDVELVFKHNLEREQIWSMVDADRRRRYHRVAAEWLEIKLGVPVQALTDDQLELLGQLHERGGETRRAGAFYLAAADAARVRFANPQAVALYGRALALIAADDASLRMEALHNLGGVLALIGRGAEAEACFREMLLLAWRYDHPAKGGAAHGRLGRLARQRGDHADALTHYQAARDLFERAGDERGVAGVLDDVGIVHWLRGAYDDAKARHAQGLALRRGLGDKRSIALSLANLGRVHHDTGAFRDALACFSEALDLRREIGDRPGVVSSLLDLGAVHHDDERVDDAHDTFVAALELAREVGDRLQQAQALGHLGEVQLALGKIDDALTTLGDADTLSGQLGDRVGQCEHARRLAEAHLVDGDRFAAEAQARRSLELAESVGSRVHLGAAQRTLACVLAAAGAATSGADHFFRGAIQLFTAVHNDLELARTYRAFAELVERRGKPTEAVHLRMRADAIFARLRGAAQARTM